jgi:hypothetical protein
MGAYDEHHFVPRFYLKNFSNNGDRASIQLYNHDVARFIPQASIKDQAREKFFYGKDNEVEKELGKLETAVGLLFHDPITKILPPAEPDRFNLLREFILIQLFRTKKAAANLIDGLNEAMQKIGPVLRADWPSDIKIAHENPALLSLYKAIEHLPLINHLAIKSIVNLTEFPFITSDAPVALYNQMMENSGSYMGATALAVKGLQIFLPIHPRLMYCLYDPYVYECGIDSNMIVKMEDDRDIHQLNALQYLFSDNHLYSDNNVSREYLEYIVQESKGFRIENRSITQINEVRNPGRTDSQWFLFNSFKDPHFNLDLSFFIIKKEALAVALQAGLPVLRHPSFESLREQINKT